MTSAQLDDVTIEYEVDGPDDGVPMLLVMGLGAQLVAWPTDVVERARGPRLPRHPDGQPRHRAVDEDRGSGADPGRALQGLRAPALRAVGLPALRHGRGRRGAARPPRRRRRARRRGVDGRDDRAAAHDRPPRARAQPLLDHVEHRRPATRQRLAPAAPHGRDVDVGAAPGGPRRGRAARRRGVPGDRRAALRRRRDRRHGAHRHQPQRQPAGHDPPAGRHPGQPRPHRRTCTRCGCRPWSSTACATSS